MKYFIIISLFVSTFICAQDMDNMREYYFVELLRIPNRAVLDSTTIANIQTAHLNNIDSLYKAGKLVLAGPWR
ncbi:MAG: hypothetical protein KKF62_05590 [Bacteroidetes bacterium]|nr:hypothetical protein [Bacteroidota bacterium]MBU1116810.1 hypothetical protein [Bacteroidota bacterium]MBU1799427.1 hypothetical protein [Bacteroidota bacterium]